MTGSAVRDPGLAGLGQRPSSPLASLRRIATRPPPDPDVESCEMCAEPIADEHRTWSTSHSRQLMCTCRACYLLFTAEAAAAALPRRARPLPVLPGLRPDPGRLGRAGDPGRPGVLLLQLGARAGSSPSTRARPGATESELRWSAWQRCWPPTRSSTCSPDVEALLVRGARRRPRARAATWCRSTPATSWSAGCGMVWRGFDGGQDARARDRRVLRRGVGAQPAAATGGERDDRPVLPVVDVVAEPLRRRAAADRSAPDHRDRRGAGPRHRAALPGRIEPQRRRYDAEETAGLRRPVRARDRWSQTLKPFLWMQCSTMVRASPASTEIDLPMP